MSKMSKIKVSYRFSKYSDDRLVALDFADTQLAKFRACQLMYNKAGAKRHRNFRHFKF